MNSLLILNVLHIVNDGLQASMLLLLPFITHEFNLTLQEAGLLGSSLNSLHIIMAIPAGILAFKYGNMRMLLIALFLSCLGFIGLSFGVAYGMFIIMFFLSGAGFGLFHPIAFSVISRKKETHVLGKNLGTFTAIGDIGRIGLGAMITFIIAIVGWRMSSRIYGVVALFLFMVFMISVSQSKKSQEKIKTHNNNIRDTVRNLLTNKAFGIAVLTGTLDAFASSALFVFLPFLLESKGISTSFLGSFTAVFFIGNLIGKYTLGSILDKTNSTIVFIAAEIAMSILIVLLVLSTSMVAIIGCSIILGMLTKGTVPVVVSMVATSFRKNESHEVGYSVNAIFNGLAFTVAPIILGTISDMFGIGYAFYVSSVFAVIATFPIIVTRITKQ